MTDRRGDPGEEERKRQLQIWGDDRRETAIGTLTEDDAKWEMVVLLEPVAGDLFRGRLSFRRGEDRHDTAPVLVEETAEAVVRRATELPTAMLRQLFASARG